MDLLAMDQVISEQRMCWVCYDTDDDNSDNNIHWVSPCRCRGSIRWVHQYCVQRWVNKKIREEPFIEVKCPQCNTKYKFTINDVNYLVKFLNMLEDVCNCIYGSIVLIYINLQLFDILEAFGKIMIKQVMGEEEGRSLINSLQNYPLIAYIPLTLVCCKAINWERPLLFAIERCTTYFPMLKSIIPSFLLDQEVPTLRLVKLKIKVSQTTSLCSALLLPSISNLVGSILFYNSSLSNIQKTVLGGLVYLGIKSGLKLYQRYHNAKSRKFIDYPDAADPDTDAVQTTN